MSDLVQLTDAEVDLVSGGLLLQLNISTIAQTAVATNTGGVTAATGAGVRITSVAVGATASNTALVEQLNLVSFRGG
ncbi:MAG TPA: hypothetical protein VJ779_01880 [Acetobacteraceae bacterium]|nr:hypothetical protein [Acetobacteraceae bacterium]